MKSMKFTFGLNCCVPMTKPADCLLSGLIIFQLSQTKVRGGVGPSIVGDEWKTAYSAGFNSTTCALVRLGENLGKGRVNGKMGIMGSMGRMGVMSSAQFSQWGDASRSGRRRSERRWARAVGGLERKFRRLLRGVVVFVRSAIGFASHVVVKARECRWRR